MADESYVQVAADGSGKKVRNLKLTEPTAVDATGAAQADTVRYEQVVNLADRRGDLLASSEFESESIDLLRKIAASLDAILVAVS